MFFKSYTVLTRGDFRLHTLDSKAREADVYFVREVKADVQFFFLGLVHA